MAIEPPARGVVRELAEQPEQERGLARARGAVHDHDRIGAGLQPGHRPFDHRLAAHVDGAGAVNKT